MRQRMVFSLGTVLAGLLTLVIAFTCSLPRPWWALLTAMVTAQPMSGAFQPKAFYRLGGVLVGAIVSIAVVPNLEHAPVLLVAIMALWTGICIYLAILDRTPRAFFFQMCAFSAAVITFPYFDDPGGIFLVAVARVEEMTIAIVSVIVAHRLLRPWSGTLLIQAKAEAFLADAARWTIDEFSHRGPSAIRARRRRLASDITELGMIAVHVPFDLTSGYALRQQVWTLQARLADLLPLASAAADRLHQLERYGRVDLNIEALLADIMHWLKGPLDLPKGDAKHLLQRCREYAHAYETIPCWDELLIASLCERMAEFIQSYQEARVLVLAFRQPVPLAERVSGQSVPLAERVRKPTFTLVRDHSLASLAGIATAVALIIYCTVWVGLGWPSGNATAAFAALITCSFAAQEDPAPVLWRYLGATLITFPLAAFYIFTVLPRIDGAIQLCIVLAPALFGIGMIQADKRLSTMALPMFSCLIVALGFLDRFQPDFANFLNVGLAQCGGIVATIVVTRLFRSMGVQWTTARMLRHHWRELQQLAEARTRVSVSHWTTRAADRLNQISARVALAPAGDAARAGDGMSDLRIGRNLIHLRKAETLAHDTARDAIRSLLSAVGAFFASRVKAGRALEPEPTLLHAIDAALNLAPTLERGEIRHQAILALAGMRCNLFPGAPAFRAAPTAAVPSLSS